MIVNGIAWVNAQDVDTWNDFWHYWKRFGSFREAYQLVGRIVKSSLEQGILLRDIPLEKWKKFHIFFEEDIYQKLLPSNVVESRLSYGGTGFERVQEELLRWRKKLFT